MHFRICCCCSSDDDKGKPPQVTTPSDVKQTTEIPSVSAIVAEQPKLSNQIQLDRITETSVEESSVQVVEENVVSPPPVITRAIKQVEDDPKPTLAKPPKQFPARFSALPNFDFSTDINGEKIEFQQIQPGVFLGFFRDGQFKIKDGVLTSTEGPYTQTDKDQIINAFAYVATRVESEVEVGLDSNTGAPKIGTTINVTAEERNGERCVLPLFVAAPGYYRSTYRGIHFYILNGQVMASNPADDYKLDKQFLLSNIEQALKSLRINISGKNEVDSKPKPLQKQLPPNMRNKKNFSFTTKFRADELTFKQVEPDIFQGTYKNKRFTLKGGEPISIEGPYTELDKDAIEFAFVQFVTNMDPNASEPDWSECLQLLQSLKNNPGNEEFVYQQISKQLDSQLGTQASLSIPRNTPHDPSTFDIDEPVLKKTTITPKEVVYQDPKEYETQDKNELVVKGLDELIISRDDVSGPGNRCYFHEARPRRVNRKKLGAKEQLRLASPERYSLFQMQCLKEHNAFRKMHGVPPLVNNEFLCEVATEWAEHLALKDAFYHRPNNDFGENLYYSSKAPISARKAVKAWYDEIDLYDYDNPKFSKEVGHFTQLVWKDTREMGTGVAVVGDKIYVCCNYNPPGNCMGKFNDEYVPRPVVKTVKM